MLCLVARNEPASEQLIVDSISGRISRLETAVGELIEVPSGWLPHGCREGDVLRLSVETGGTDTVLRVSVDLESTAERRNRVRGKLDELRKRGNK